MKCHDNTHKWQGTVFACWQIVVAEQPGYIPDVSSLSNSLKQLDVLEVTKLESITDNGFNSEVNMAEMCLLGFRFITLEK